MREFIAQNQWIILALQLWTIPWKGFSLWLASKNDHKLWFIALLLLQTLGILDIIYIFIIAKYRFNLRKVTSLKAKK
jgi:hypothetical protein